jgi:hypothetical protein
VTKRGDHTEAGDDDPWNGGSCFHVQKRRSTEEFPRETR